MAKVQHIIGSEEIRGHPTDVPSPDTVSMTVSTDAFSASTICSTSQVSCLDYVKVFKAKG